MAKKSKSEKKRKRRKLSKLLKEIPAFKKRIPTCKGGFSFKSKKDYNRNENKKIVKEEISD